MFDDTGKRLSLNQIRELVSARAERIGALDQSLPTYGSSADFARPHIEVDDRYHWVIVERGAEVERRSTTALDELLYWIFESVTFSLASDYEVRHRKPDEDSRRGLFSKQLELLFLLDERWSDRREAKLAEVLARHPYSDERS